MATPLPHQGVNDKDIGPPRNAIEENLNREHPEGQAELACEKGAETYPSIPG
jgi:hypothetical protein